MHRIIQFGLMMQDLWDNDLHAKFFHLPDPDFIPGTIKMYMSPNLTQQKIYNICNKFPHETLLYQNFPFWSFSWLSYTICVSEQSHINHILIFLTHTELFTRLRKFNCVFSMWIVIFLEIKVIFLGYLSRHTVNVVIDTQSMCTEVCKK